ncbi:carboxypeptidase regulatory-like domain-containing protein [Silvibacterium sp.]|uniref:TonB-dependent receptor n=1 Tax=Silvibacterium sp. TaxID=1964179 RepID=UPI0039E45562
MKRLRKIALQTGLATGLVKPLATLPAARLLAAATLGLACTVSPLFAQVDQGGVSGTITDQTGAVIPGATITLTNTDNGLSLTQKSNGSGQYNFTPVKVGNYSLKVSADGFETSERGGIRVDVSGFVGVNMKLNPGAVSQVVEVKATTELQTQDAATGQTFTTQQIEDSPLQGRNYLFLAQITTGVNAPNQGNTQTAGSGAFSSNGSRVAQNNFILDGVDNNSNMQDFLNGATYAVAPPPDALEEFKVQSSDYSAELGHSTGAAVNASIKSGTNQVHGSLWEYFRSDRMTANDYFNTSGSTAYHSNVFGATLGGPIIKDKLFIFADGQGTRISSFVPEQPKQTVPTDLMKTGDFSEMLDANNVLAATTSPITLYKTGGNVTPSVGASEVAKDPSRYLACSTTSGYYAGTVTGQNVICPGSINAIAQNILKLFPEPNAGTAHQVFDNYTIPATAATNDTTQYDVKMDWNPTSKDQAFGRYSYSNNPQNYTPPFPVLDGGSYGSDGQVSNYAKSGVFSETHFFSPTFSNEFRVGYNYLHASYLQDNSQTNVAAAYGLGGIPYAPDLGGFPDISFGGYINSIGVPSYMPSDEKQDVIEFIDNVSKVIGQHTLKVGVNLQHIRFYGLQTPNPTGSQSFSGTYTEDPGDLTGAITGSGVADFLLDDMNSSSINSHTPFTDLRWYDAAFVQDDWKVRKNLTLNLGLRWEYTQPFEELHDEQANFVGDYAGMNQGSGTFYIPESQSGYAIPATISALFAKDNINVAYTSDRSLVKPQHWEFAPRFGLAYQPKEGMVIRAGYGFFYGGQENIGLGLNLANNPPFFLSSSFNPEPNQCYNTAATGVVCPTNGQTLETGFGADPGSEASLAANVNLPTLYQQDVKAKSTYTMSYNSSVQQAITSTSSFTISYQGNVTRRLRVSYSANQFPGNVPSGANSQLYQPFYDFGTIDRVVNEGVGAYNSLQAKIEKKYSHGLYFLAGYTWSHSLDDAVEPIQGSDGQTSGNPAFTGLRFNYGASTTDVRNRFTFSPTYDLPFGQGQLLLNHGGLVNQIVGGWKLAAIFQAQTGTPIAFNGLFKVGDPFGTGGTPNAKTQHNETCVNQVRTLQHWYNPCAFAQAPTAVTSLASFGATDNVILLSEAGTKPFGQGRLTIPGPGLDRTDLSLFKTFNLGYRKSAFTLRADAFNVFNHPSFGDPGTSVTGTSAGDITKTRFSTVLPNARTIEVAGRLTF